jgi:hypothetical protein
LIRSAEDDLERLTIDGRDVGAVVEREGRLRGYRSSVDVAARSRSELEAKSRIGGIRRSGDAYRYRLHVLRQAVARPDFAEIEIHVPPGWKVTGKTSFLGDLTQDVVLDVRLERTARGAIVQRVFVEPFRLARRLLRDLF